MAWKIFNSKHGGRGARKFDFPVISVSKYGRIVLNSYAKVMLVGSQAESAHLQLLTDSDNLRIGIRQIPEMAIESYPLRKAARSQTYFISALALLNTGKMRPNSLQYFRPTFEDNMLVVDLKTPYDPLLKM